MLSLRQIILLKNSLALALGATLLSLALGISLALLTEKGPLSRKKLIYSLLIVPLLIPPYLHALGWRFLVVNFLPNGFNGLLYSIPSAIFIFSLALFPLVFFITTASLKNLGQSLEEAACLTASRWKILRQVTLPLISPGLFSAALIIFILTLTSFGLPSLLHVNVFTFEIFSQFSAFFDFQKAFFLTWPFLLVSLAASLVLLKHLDSLFLFSREISPNRFKLISNHRLSKSLSFIYLIFLITLSALIPVGIFVAQVGGFNQMGLIAKTALETLPKSLFTAILGGLGITTLALLLQFPTLFANKASLQRKQNLLRLLLLSSLALPSVSWGILLVQLFNRPSLQFIYLSWGMILLGYLARFLPYGFEVLRFFIRRVDPQLIEAAVLTGAGQKRLVQEIWLPLLKPGLLITFLLGFVFSLTELGTTLLIAPPGWQTLPARIYTLLHYGAPDLVAGLSLVLILAILITPALGYKLIYKRL